TARGRARLLYSGLSTATSRLDARREKSRRLAYKAPEQLRAGIDAVPLDPTTDLFAMAAVLWELITGTSLFEAPTDALVVERILGGAPPSMEKNRAGAPPELVAVVLAGLRAGGEEALENADRFADMLGGALAGHIA